MSVVNLRSTNVFENTDCETATTTMWKKWIFFLFVLQVLRNVVLFLVLSPYDNEQSDLIHRVGEEKTLEEISLYRYIMLNEIWQGQTIWILVVKSTFLIYKHMHMVFLLQF